MVMCNECLEKRMARPGRVIEENEQCGLYLQTCVVDAEPQNAPFLGPDRHTAWFYRNKPSQTGRPRREEAHLVDCLHQSSSRLRRGHDTWRLSRGHQGDCIEAAGSHHSRDAGCIWSPRRREPSTWECGTSPCRAGLGTAAKSTNDTVILGGWRVLARTARCIHGAVLMDSS